MTSGGYRVDLGTLRSGERGLRELSDDVRRGIRQPPAPPVGGNAGFTSAQAAIAAAEAWEAEVDELAAVLQTAGDKLAQTVAEYDRADVSGAHGFQRILREGC